MGVAFGPAFFSGEVGNYVAHSVSLRIILLQLEHNIPTLGEDLK